LVAAMMMTPSLALEAVHLDEQLVERLLALVVAAAHAGAAVAADGVDLVDEDDAGRVLLALLEQVADARRADADEHLDEVRARDREERHARLAGDGAGEQRLAGARRAHEQHALGDAPPSSLNLARIFSSSAPATSVEGGLPALVLLGLFYMGLSELHHFAAARAAGRLVHHIHPQRDHNDDYQYLRQPHQPPRRLPGLDIIVSYLVARVFGVVIVDELIHALDEKVYVGHGVFDCLCLVVVELQRKLPVAKIQREIRDPVGLEIAHDGRVFGLFGLGLILIDDRHREHKQDEYDNVRADPAHIFTQ
jgi:hypothetical protein